MAALPLAATGSVTAAAPNLTEVEQFPLPGDELELGDPGYDPIIHEDVVANHGIDLGQPERTTDNTQSQQGLSDELASLIGQSTPTYDHLALSTTGTEPSLLGTGAGMLAAGTVLTARYAPEVVSVVTTTAKAGVSVLGQWGALSLGTIAAGVGTFGYVLKLDVECRTHADGGNWLCPEGPPEEIKPLPALDPLELHPSYGPQAAPPTTVSPPAITNVFFRPLTANGPALYDASNYGDGLPQSDTTISPNRFNPKTQRQEWEEWEWEHGTLGSTGIPDGTAVMMAGTDDEIPPGPVSTEEADRIADELSEEARRGTLAARLVGKPAEATRLRGIVLYAAKVGAYRIEGMPEGPDKEQLADRIQRLVDLNEAIGGFEVGGGLAGGVAAAIPSPWSGKPPAEEDN